MKAKEYKDKINGMTLEELYAEEKELKSQLFKLRFQHATTQMENPVQIKYVKRDIARVKTVIREKQLAAGESK